MKITTAIAMTKPASSSPNFALSGKRSVLQREMSNPKWLMQWPQFAPGVPVIAPWVYRHN
jgi:hypothetical protein